MDSFIGRDKQLSLLKQLTKKKSSSLVVIKGRRRIGKSRLAEEFCHLFSHALVFSGLPPDKNITASNQRDEFVRQLRAQNVPSYGAQDWGDIFYDLAQYAESKKIVIVLDEITWMGGLDPTFLGKLKIAWDMYFKKNPTLIMIISGSNSAWIEANILSKTGFFGRISLRISLEELPLYQCNEFWGSFKNKISSHEKFKILAVTGGIPRYLEEIHPEETAEQNIYRLCYQREGVLFNEFDDIFSDLFQKRSDRYKNIIHCIADGKTTVDEIAIALERTKGGDLSESLNELIQDGLISRDYSWSLKTGTPSKISQYRVSDNYLRFYLKYILPYKQRIEIEDMQALPVGWQSILGLQFENLVVNNRRLLHRLLNISPEEIVACNPYFQPATQKYPACQIDYLIQTRFNTLYLCEIKFSKTEVNSSVIKDVQEKIDNLVIARGFSIRPVLIHVNGVSDSVIAANFFAHLIDFSDFLNGQYSIANL
ncbi:ATP-binding protein [bacterium]|nr:ATP-binding protein [bacterium]